MRQHCSNVLYCASVYCRGSNLDYDLTHTSHTVDVLLCNTFVPLQSQRSKTRSLLLSACHVTFCIKLLQSFPNFPPVQLWERFQGASEELNEMRPALEKTCKIIQPVLYHWMYKKLALCPGRKRLLKLQAVWVWNGDKIRSRQSQCETGDLCELERCCSLSAPRVCLM